MRRFGAAASLLIAVAAAGVPASALDIQRVVSEKGVVAWFVPDRSVPLIALSFAFRRSGSSTDPQDRNGLAEMVSGLLDEGAGDMESRAFRVALDDIAARLSFYADRDDFGGRLQTLASSRDRAFGLLRLAITKPRFDAEPVSRIRREILAGLERRAERPRRIARLTWNETAFPGHPYGRPDSGTTETVTAITAEDLKGFVRSRFGRNRLVVGVVGDIAVDELRRRLDEIFGDLPQSATEPFAIARRSPADAGRTVVVRKQNPQSVMVFGHEGLRRDDPDWYAAVLVTYVLGGGQTSRLYREVRGKRGLAYAVYAGLSPMDGAALIAGQVATRNARAGEALGLIRSEWRRIAEHGITEDELRGAKSYINGSFPLRFETGRGIAGMLVGIQLSRLGIDYVERRSGLFDRVTLADANRVARRLFRADDLTVVAVGDPADVPE